MDKPAEELRILMLEDLPSDAELVVQILQDEGLVFTSMRVDTEAAFKRALQEFAPHLVLADYRLPAYNGRDALEYSRRTHPQIPVIMVTGTLGDETAVELLKLGATDYVLKDGLARLAPAIKRALSEEQSIRAGKQAEAKLKLFRTLLDNSSDAIEVLDPVTMRFLDMNETECRVLGYSREELLSMNAFDIDAGIGADSAKMIEEQLQQSGHAQLETVHRRKDGSTFPVEISVTSVELDKPYLLSIARDITERKLMERYLRESEARYKRITEGITDYQYTVRIENGHAVETTQSPACMTVTGYTAEEFAANPHLWIQMVVPEDRDRVMKQVQHILAGEDVSPIEHRITRKDGEIRWISDTAILFRDASGKLLSYDGVIKDITRRKENETKIVRLNRIYAVLSGINMMIVRVRKEEELFKEACHIAVEHGGFVFAWIGKLDADSQQVTPVAQAGRDDSYLAQINLTAREDTPGSCALTAQALTEAKPVICNDIAGDERMAAWRSAALSRGYLSVVVFPLILEGKPVGVFVLYAAEIDVFDDEEMKLLVEIAGDISFAMDNLKKEAKLNYLAYYDVITGLPNRALLTDRITYALSMARRSHAQLAVMFLDLDHFKHVNDTLGHHIGDELLKEVAKCMKSVLREQDTVSRQGGDEFILVLPDTDANGAARLAEKLLEVIAQDFHIEQHELVITPSIGIAMYPDDGEDFDALSKCADVAMYRAKRDGRNNFRFFTQEMQIHSARTLQLDNALRHALKRDQLRLHYQPQVSLQDGRIIGAEALLRWQHPEFGTVSPAEFIPIAESGGQILQIGEWVLRTAVHQLKTWMDSGLEPMIIAVNLSAVQFRHAHLPELVTQILEEAKLPPQYLELELTEGVAMNDPLGAWIQPVDATSWLNRSAGVS